MTNYDAHLAAQAERHMERGDGTACSVVFVYRGEEELEVHRNCNGDVDALGNAVELDADEASMDGRECYCQDRDPPDEDPREDW